MAKIILRGKGEILNIYRVKDDLEIDTINYDLASEKDQEMLYKKVEELISTGEIDAIMPSTQFRILFRDDVAIEIEGNEYSIDEVEMKVKGLEELLENLEDIKEGEIIYLSREVGEGDFIFDVDKEKVDLNKITLSYIDCNNYEDTFIEDINEILCDSINIDSLNYANSKIEESEWNFVPMNLIDELYIVKYNTELDVYFLERLDVGGTKLIGSDDFVDDIDKN